MIAMHVHSHDTTDTENRQYYKHIASTVRSIHTMYLDYRLDLLLLDRLALLVIFQLLAELFHDLSFSFCYYSRDIFLSPFSFLIQIGRRRNLTTPARKQNKLVGVE